VAGIGSIILLRVTPCLPSDAAPRMHAPAQQLLLLSGLFREAYTLRPISEAYCCSAGYNSCRISSKQSQPPKQALASPGNHKGSSSVAKCSDGTSECLVALQQKKTENELSLDEPSEEYSAKKPTNLFFPSHAMYTSS